LKILARHLTIDMYNCKTNKLITPDLLQASLREALTASKFTIINADFQITEGEQATAFILLKEGHISVHSFPDLKYTAVDVFTCAESSQPEKVLAALRKFFKPEKTKMTSLKRGDFGTVKDMKPKIKTRIAPLRRIRNTGAKVIHLLARRKVNKQ